MAEPKVKERVLSDVEKHLSVLVTGLNGSPEAKLEPFESLLAQY